MKLFYKLLCFLDNVVYPYLRSTATYKECDAWVKYEIEPGSHTLKLYMGYASSDDDGFLEFSLVNVYFTIGDKITMDSEYMIDLKDNETKELLKLLNKGVEELND